MYRTIISLYTEYCMILLLRSLCGISGGAISGKTVENQHDYWPSSQMHEGSGRLALTRGSVSRCVESNTVWRYWDATISISGGVQYLQKQLKIVEIAEIGHELKCTVRVLGAYHWLGGQSQGTWDLTTTLFNHDLASGGLRYISQFC